MCDNDIINIFFNTKNKKLNCKWKSKLNNDILNYLMNRYVDSSCLLETLYRINNNIEIRPTCKTCGGYVKFVGNSFNNHCSNRCASLDKNVQEKSKETCFKKYGVNYTFQSDNNKIKSKETKKEKYGDENYNNSYQCLQTKLEKYGTTTYCNNYLASQTNLIKYGYICPLQNSIINEKARKTMLNKYDGEYTLSSYILKQNVYKTKLEKYGDETYNNFEKIKQTKFEKYGNETYTNPEKVKQTCIKKYGVDNAAKNKDVINKINVSKQKNHTFNTSKPEEECYILLKENYEEVIRQYKSDEYPFSCDFYIPEIDTYIEYNGLWTHGGKPYEGTEEDEIKLNEWKIKSENSKFYRNAIHNWIETDVNKRKIAKKNNLNYIEFWNLDEVKLWITKKG